MYKTIIWATDGSEEADAALEEARYLSAMSGARIVAVHCDQRLSGRTGSWPAAADEEDRRAKIERQVAELTSAGERIGLVIRRSHREAADVIASAADELHGDVLVCGSRGLGSFTGAFVGSVTHRLLRIAPCPVLTIRQRRPADVPVLERERAVEYAGVDA